MAVNCRGFMRGNLPEFLESAEMVNANVVAGFHCPAHALNPPLVAASTHHVPTIKRITPALPAGAERVGRYSRHDFRIQVLIKAEKVGIGPNVRTIVIYKNSDITGDLDRLAVAIAADRMPLLEKCELDYPLEIQLFSQVTAGLLKSRFLAPGQFARPFIPTFGFVVVTQSIKKHKILEPPVIVFAEPLKSRAV